MSEFDDMLKAGVISPGSTPFVEGKRAPARDHPEISAQKRVLEEQRTSWTVHDRTPLGQMRQTALLAVGSIPRALAIGAALQTHFVCIHIAVRYLARDVALVIAEAGFPELEALVSLGHPVLLIGGEHPAPNVRSIAAGWQSGALLVAATEAVQPKP